MSRSYTENLLEMIEEGLLDKDNVIMALVKYMSEAEVKDCMECNEFIDSEDDEMVSYFMIYDIRTYLEDGATVTEVRDENNKLIDSLYIGSTTWDYNNAQARKELEDFKKKYEVKK